MISKIESISYKLSAMGFEVVDYNNWAIKYIDNDLLYVMDENRTKIVEGEKDRPIGLFDYFILGHSTIIRNGGKVGRKKSFLYIKEIKKDIMKEYSDFEVTIENINSKIAILYKRQDTKEKKIVTNTGKIIDKSILQYVKQFDLIDENTYRLIDYSDRIMGRLIIEDEKNRDIVILRTQTQEFTL